MTALQFVLLFLLTEAILSLAVRAVRMIVGPSRDGIVVGSYATHPQREGDDVSFFLVLYGGRLRGIWAVEVDEEEFKAAEWLERLP